jgi:hypothetical protein
MTGSATAGAGCSPADRHARPLPSFVVIGAEKSGTTALAEALSRHPSIHVPKAKELRYFSSHNWARGLDWYTSQFSPEPGVTCMGEASPAYSLFPVEPNVVPRMRATLGPGLRLVYLVRDPIERLVSHYLHAITYGWVAADTPVDEAVEQAPLLVTASLYATQLARYHDHFGPDSVHVVVFEDMAAAGVVGEELLDFVGAPRLRLPLEPSNVTSDRGGLPGRLARVKPAVRNGLPEWARGPLREVSNRWERPLPDRDAVRRDVRTLGLGRALRREATALSDAVSRDLVGRWGLEDD